MTVSGIPPKNGKNEEREVGGGCESGHKDQGNRM